MHVPPFEVLFLFPFLSLLPFLSLFPFLSLLECISLRHYRSWSCYSPGKFMQQDGVSQWVAYALNIVAFPAARCLHSQFYQLPHWLLVDSALPLWPCYRPGNHLCSRTLRGTGLLSSQQCRLGLDMRHTSALPFLVML